MRFLVADKKIINCIVMLCPADEHARLLRTGRAGCPANVGFHIMQRDQAGVIAPFCVAIKQVAERFAAQREARAAGIARKPAP